MTTTQTEVCYSGRVITRAITAGAGLQTGSLWFASTQKLSIAKKIVMGFFVL